VVAPETDPAIRRRVLASAERLIREGSGASISRIATEAGVSRATFYRHFGSRAALLETLDVSGPVTPGDRILATAAEMLQRQPLAAMSMDELAVRAGVGRATLYRLYPGKAHLLQALIGRYAPFEEVLSVIQRHRAAPPEVVVPELARTIVRSVLPRLGVVRAVLMETTSGEARNLPGVRPVLRRALGVLVAYLGEQMDAGRLRRMHPLLALQALLGPIAFHLLTRPVAEQVAGLEVDPETAAEALAAAVLEGMLP
jgi:AcrR family transcriptional regulator